MVLNGIQVLGFSLGVLSWIGMIGTCVSPEWRKSSQGHTLIDSQLRYEGLWLKCTSFVTGQTQCEGYNAFFIGLPGVMQVCRGFIISAIVLGFIAIFVTLPGLKCTTIGPSSKILKSRMALLGGLLFGVAGVAMAASCSFAFIWAFNDGYDVMKSFFIGLGSAIGGFVSSVLVCAGSCTSSSNPGPNDKVGPFRALSFNRNDAKRENPLNDVEPRNPIYVSDYI